MPDPNPYETPRVEFNPYEAPQADLTPAGRLSPRDFLWREGPLLIMRKGAIFPDRCVKCNAPAEGRRFKRTLRWHPPLIYALVLISPLIYIIVALIASKTAQIEVGLCREHRARRRKAIAVGWLLALLGIAGIIVGVADQRLVLLILIGTVVILVGMIYGLVRSQVVVAKRIDKEFAWLQKVHPDFLATLPDWGL